MIYSFKTESFEVRGYAEPETMDPADQLDEEAAADIEAGNSEWFRVRVEVLKNGHVIGYDTLGGCHYGSVREFFTSHRDPDPMNRNCSIMRKARGDNVAICHYFPDMVKQAIADARRVLDGNLE
jgi:hypothetical protein